MISKMRRTVVTFAAAALALVATPFAEGPAPAQAALEADKAATLRKVERYLNGITSMHRRRTAST